MSSIVMWAAKGDTVRFQRERVSGPPLGTEKPLYDEREALKILVIDHVYVVDRTEVTSGTSKIWLQGINQPFNTVLFSRVQIDEERAFRRKDEFALLAVLTIKTRDGLLQWTAHWGRYEAQTRHESIMFFTGVPELLVTTGRQVARIRRGGVAVVRALESLRETIRRSLQRNSPAETASVNRELLAAAIAHFQEL
jgi:hypothetical protein